MQPPISRRRFLSRTAVGAAGLGLLAAPAPLRAQNDPAAKVKFSGNVSAREYLKSKPQIAQEIEAKIRIAVNVPSSSAVTAA